MDEKRFNELYNRAYEHSYKVFSEFLNMDEQSILANTYLPCVTFGGYENAQRIAAGFGENIKNSDFPITCLKVSPVIQKFSDNLNHRDFLGALMNLGLKREMLGDIIIENNCGYVFCLNKVSSYIIDNLKKIKHTTVTAEIAQGLPENANKLPDASQLIVSSLRLDVLICAVYNISRNNCSKLFKTEKVFVNSRLVENNSYNIKNGDVISVRGFGRFIFEEQIRNTKKERIVVSVRKY